MYESLLRLWKKGKLTEQLLDTAISLNWITVEEKEKIKNTVVSQLVDNAN